MHPIRFIRLNVLKITQTEMAEVTRVSQATVCRWETGELEPNRTEMEAMRRYAYGKGLRWNDRWFFKQPTRREVEGA